MVITVKSLLRCDCITIYRYCQKKNHIFNFTYYLYSFPKFVYKKLFDRTYIQYILETLKYFGITFVTVFITAYITKIIDVGVSNFTELIKNMIICIILPNLIYLVIFYNTDEFKYFKEIFTRFIKYNKET